MVDDESKERCAGVPRAKSSEEDTEGLVLPGGFVVTDDLRDSDDPRPTMEAVEYFLTVVWILAMTRSSDGTRTFFSGSGIGAPTGLCCCKAHDFLSLSETSVIATLTSEDELPESNCMEFLREGLGSGKDKGWLDGISHGYTSSHIEEDPAVTEMLPVFLLATSGCEMTSVDVAGVSEGESQGQTSSLGFSPPPPLRFSCAFDPSSVDAAPDGSLKHHHMRSAFTFQIQVPVQPLHIEIQNVFIPTFLYF